MGNKQKELPTGLAIREKNRYDTIRVDNSNVFFPVIYEEFPTPPRFTLIKQYDLAKYNVKKMIELKDGNFLIASTTSEKMIVILDKKTFKELYSISDSRALLSGVTQLENCNIAVLLSNGKITVYSLNNKQANIIKEFDVVGERMRRLQNNCIACYPNKENTSDIMIYDLTSLSDIKKREITCKYKIRSLLQPDSNKDILVVAHSLKIISFYNIKDNVKIEKDIQCKEDLISSLKELNDGRIIIGGNSTFVIINCKTYQIECFYEDLFCCENKSFLQLKDKSLLIGTGLSNAGRFCLLGSNLQVIARQKRVHKERIMYLTLIDDNIVLSFSLDKTVKIWSYK